MKDRRQILNIVNFIRGYDSEPMPKGETYKTVREQIKLIDKYNFKSTFLIQYDALQFPEYKSLMPSLDKSRYEVGVWFEVNKPLAEDCGIEWKGKREWDGRVNCGFPMGYGKEERAKMIDRLFEQFFSVMGYYPRVLGSWFFDSFSIRYIYEKYGLDALCNCKEQYGTDGYTLWGGYYGQAYYPSVTNVFVPAQSEDQQMKVPLFRMLGSDQVYQYDCGRNDDFSPRKSQSVITLEPVYKKAGGGLNSWVDWYLKENFNGECLSFGYAQAGQENSFGWEAMKDGLIYQFARFAELQKENKIEIETLGESGRWYKKTFSKTPASSITAHCAFDDDKKDSLWYCSAYYRINLYGEENHLRIRDIHLFDQSIEDPFENSVCRENFAVYETLPVVDGFIFSGGGIKSGVYLFDKGSKRELSYEKMIFSEKSCDECVAEFVSESDSITFDINEKGFEISRKDDFIFENKIGRKGDFLPKVKIEGKKKAVFSYNGKEYSLTLISGIFSGESTVSSENGKVKVMLETNGEQL